MAATSAQAGDRATLGLRHVTLDLPGPPSKVLSWDVDGDGRRELVLVVAYREIDEIGDSRVEDLVEVATVIPALFDRRELRIHAPGADGELQLAVPPLALPKSVLHLEAGPAGVGLLALTDEGLARVVHDPESSSVRLDLLIADPPVLAATETFQARLSLVADLDGDGDDDVLLPARSGPAVYLTTPEGLATEPASRIVPPRATAHQEHAPGRWYPWPEILDVNGDGAPDLVFWLGFGERERSRPHVLLGNGTGRFRPLRTEAQDCHDEGSDLRIEVEAAGTWPWPDGLVELRDLDGDGRAEAVTRTEQSRGDGFRKGMKDAKRPLQEYRFHRLTDGVALAGEPYQRLTVLGHSWGNESDPMLPSTMRQFQDLDGDGRADLITFTLDFSIFQALRVLTTKRISIGVDFHVWAQGNDGSFREVPNLDLSEKLKVDLSDLKLGRFGQFAGDFDGDGRQDFVHLGRGREVTIHTGQPGCVYRPEPDLVIELAEEPASLDLIRIEDLDGDARSDLRVTRLLPQQDVDLTPPVRLDLYLSGSAW